MSYVATAPIPITMQDGTSLMVAQLPIQDISDTFFESGSQKLQALVPVIADQIIQYIDSYAQSALWPTVRAEVDRATSNAEERTVTLAKSTGKQALAIGSLVFTIAAAAGWLYLKGRR